MVGIVLVSHSAKLAEGVAELAREMGGDVRVEPAGGIEAPEPAFGTDAALVAAAIERADSGDGVLVLMDLGSAVLSAEMAAEFVDPSRRVLLTEAPMVEGAVAAAVSASAGAALESVAAEAREGLRPKEAHLGSPAPAAAPAAAAGGDGAAQSLSLVVPNRLGLHARPAARFVQTASAFDADVTVTNVTTGAGPAGARSLSALATLGVRQGHEILVSARGPQAREALDALRALAERSFGDEPEAAQPAAAAASRAERPSGSLSGFPAAPGAATGPARHVHQPALAVPAGRAKDPDAEWAALRSALASTRHELEEVRAGVAARAGEYSAAIFDAHLLLLDDETLLEPARRAIYEERNNAAAAFSEAAEAAAAAYRALEDDYQRTRAEDVVAVANRVVAALAGHVIPRPSLAEPGILVAPDLTPADTAALDPSFVRGIATAQGGPTSHSAILARALGLPAVVGVGETLLAVAEGTELLLDGDAGLVYVEPPAEVRAEVAARTRERERALLEAREAARQPALTRDGRRIEVGANLGAGGEVEAAVAAGADGVGLLRTEFLFLQRDSLPDEDEQAAAYGAIAERLAGKPLVLRTLDVGGDKPLPYLPRPSEANPFLGVRGIRLALAEPELLETQLRAALRVAASYPLSVMFPMVATLEEYREARSALHRERERLEAAEVATGDLDLGVMVEVPAAALAAQVFAPEVDFFSIGTNDLTQYAMAAERGNDAVARLADALHPAILRLVGSVTAAAEEHGKWVGVCGELASDPLAVPVLVGLGVTELSVGPAEIATVKQAVRSIDVESARELAASALSLGSAAEVRRLVAEGQRAGAAA